MQLKKGRKEKLSHYDENQSTLTLTCQCNLPRPNSFTGNCINCNKIIKPIIDKDVNKYTK